MECLADRFSLRQMTDPDSELFLSGMEIRSGLEKVTGKPVYYFFYRYKSRLGNCPLCGGKWQPSPYPAMADYICKNCRLATDAMCP